MGYRLWVMDNAYIYARPYTRTRTLARVLWIGPEG
jgi:hypothetical protein